MRCTRSIRKLRLALLLLCAATAWSTACSTAPATSSAPSTPPASTDAAERATLDEPETEPDAPAPARTERPDDRDETEWLEELSAREVELPGRQDVSLADGAIRLRAPSAEPLEIQRVDETTYGFELALGTDAKIQCWLYTEELDPATTLQEFSESLLDAVDQVEERQILRVDTSHVGPTPYLGIDWLYRYVGADGDPLIGTTKQLIANKDGRTLLCLHDEVGYLQTFDSAFRAVLESLDGPSAADPGLTRDRFELTGVEIAGQPVGYIASTYSVDPEGDVQILIRSAMLLPVDRSSLQATDSVELEWSTAEGELLNGYSIEGEGDEVTTNLRIDPLESAGGWRVDGTFQGKPLEATFEGDLDSSLALPRAIRQLIADGTIGGAVEVQGWEASIDPVGVVPSRIELRELLPDGGARVTIAVQPLELDAVTSADGWITEMSSEIAGTRMLFRQLVLETGPEQ